MTLKFETCCFLATLTALGCADDRTVVIAPRADVPEESVVRAESLDHLRAAQSPSGPRASTDTALSNESVSLVDSTISGSPAARSRSASFVMISTLQLGVQ